MSEQFDKFEVRRLVTRIFLCVIGYVVVMGVIAENQPWGRGWFHDLRWLARLVPHSDWRLDDTPQDWITGFTEACYGNYDAKHHAVQHDAFQRRFVDWREATLKAQPDLNPTFREVPDEENGLLRIFQWLEEDPSLGFPDLPEELYDMEFVDENGKRRELSPEDLNAIEAHLAPLQPALERALRIGLLSDRSVKGIAADQWRELPIAAFKKANDHLQLKIRLHAHRGDAAGALLAARALKGWGRHFIEAERVTLLDCALGLALQLGLQNLVLEDVLPALGTDFDHAAWEPVIANPDDPEALFDRMFLGEWQLGVQYLLPDTLPAYNPRDLEALLAAYTQGMDQMRSASPATFPEMPSAPRELTLMSRRAYQEYVSGVGAYVKGFVRAMAVSRQRQVAFTLLRWESEGRDISLLDAETRSRLDLEVMPGVEIKVDPAKRVLSVSMPPGGVVPPPLEY